MTQRLYAKFVVFYALFEKSKQGCLLILVARIHKFGVGVVINVSNVNDAWPASAWWRRQANNALCKGTIVNSTSMEGTMSLRCCRGGDYSVIANVTWGILRWDITNRFNLLFDRLGQINRLPDWMTSNQQNKLAICHLEKTVGRTPPFPSVPDVWQPPSCYHRTAVRRQNRHPSPLRSAQTIIYECNVLGNWIDWVDLNLAGLLLLYLLIVAL